MKISMKVERNIWTKCSNANCIRYILYIIYLYYLYYIYDKYKVVLKSDIDKKLAEIRNNVCLFQIIY